LPASAEVGEDLVSVIDLVDQTSLRVPAKEVLFMRLVALGVTQEMILKMTLRLY
jgi:hypothetical protein